jgi:hypothetical protein
MLGGSVELQYEYVGASHQLNVLYYLNNTLMNRKNFLNYKRI